MRLFLNYRPAIRRPITAIILIVLGRFPVQEYVMKRPFAVSVWREGNWYVSQCPEVDLASQGETEVEAFTNLREASERHF